MALSNEFKEWFRKSVFSHSAGGYLRFNKLVKRLENKEAGRPVRRVRPANTARDAIVSNVVESFEEWDLLPDLLPSIRMLTALHDLADYYRETKTPVA